MGSKGWDADISLYIVAGVYIFSVALSQTQV
jgi:hypothetical protein